MTRAERVVALNYLVRSTKAPPPPSLHSATPKEKTRLAFLIWRGVNFLLKKERVFFLSGFCPPSIRAVWRGEMRNSDGAGGGGWGEESRAVLALIFKKFAPEFLDSFRRKSYNEFVNQLTKYQKRVYKVLAEQNFIVGDTERKIIQKRTTNDRRYFFMVAKRIEGKNIIERFIKIPENNTKKLLLPFLRQIEIAKYIKAHRVINTRGVVASNYDPKKGVPFVVMETFPTNQSKIGFIEGDKGVELLDIREARQTIDQLQKFHSISIKTLPTRLKKILKIYPGDYKGLRREVFRYLNKKVKPLDSKDKVELFHQVLERRLGIPEIKIKAKKLLAQLEPIIDSKSSRIPSIVHGDMAPNNLYVFNSGDVELLDLEWVGVFKNKAIAMILDFGNLRARSWRNEKFRNALDDALVKIYQTKGQEEIGRAIVQLSILRSHIQLSGFFENYARPKQKDPLQTRRRKQTEHDIAKAFV